MKTVGSSTFTVHFTFLRCFLPITIFIVTSDQPTGPVSRHSVPKTQNRNQKPKNYPEMP